MAFVEDQFRTGGASTARSMTTPRGGSSRVFGSIIEPNLPVHPGLAGKASTSSNMGRLSQLNSQILKNREQHDAENTQRSEVMEQKIKTLDDKILRSAISEEEKMKPLQDQISQASNDMMAERSSSELRDDVCSKDICACLHAANLDVAAMRKARVDAESKLVHSIQEVMEATESDLKRQAKEHIKWEEDQKKYVADELTNFVQSTEAQITERHNDFSTLERRIADEVRRLTVQVQGQAEARQQLEVRLGKMIEEKAGNLAHEVVKERALREELEEKLCAEVFEEMRRVEQRVDLETQTRVAHEKAAINRMNLELNDIQQMVNTEIAVRQESGKALVQILESMTARMAEELAGEKADRVSMEQNFIHMMQRACQRANVNISDITPREMLETHRSQVLEEQERYHRERNESLMPY